jgi:hypothetical protein
MLVSTNEEALRINLKRLSGINETEKTYEAYVQGDEYKREAFFKNSKVQEKLTLKIGAQVMCITNKYADQSVVNGSV